MHFVRRNGQRQLFNHLQRHHFPGDFGKAFCAALDLHIALLVKAYDIAGVVPAGFDLAVDIFCRWRFQHARVFYPQVAVHDVRPFQLQASALFNARNGEQTRVHPR